MGSEDDLSAFIRRHIEGVPTFACAATPSRTPDRLWRGGSVRGRPHIEWVRPELAEYFPYAPVRSPGRSSRSWSRGWQTRTPSRKTDRIIRSASRLEAQHVRDTEFDRDVEGMVEQPMALRLPDGTKYRPDAFVWMRGVADEVREVKFEEEARCWEMRWCAVGEYLSNHGLSFRVVTEARMRHPPRAANVNLLMASRHVEVPPEPYLDIVWRECRTVPFTIGGLIERFPELGMRQVYALVRLGFLAIVDLDEPIDAGSSIELFRRRIKRPGAPFRNDVPRYDP